MAYILRWHPFLRRWFGMTLFCLILLMPLIPASAEDKNPPIDAFSDESSLPQILAVSSDIDEYGYSLTGVPINWIELQTAIEPTITVTSTLNLTGIETYSELIDMGFTYPFPFYENEYEKISISRSGLLFFSSGTKAPLNQPIPFDIQPNNFIAPYWDNLILIDNSAIYYGQGTLAGKEIFVVEWKNVVFLGSNLTQTFEVVLFENGDILLQYLSLTDNTEGPGYTVGIEDSHGLDGIQKFYNEDGLNNNTAYLIDRPDDAPRVSITPPFSSTFSESGTARLELTIWNTGSTGGNPSQFELILTDTSNWEITLFNSDGVTPLSDEDNDNKPESSLIAEGDYFDVIVKVEAPDAAAISYIQPSVTATLYDNDEIQDTAVLQVAVPARFMQSYSNNTRMWTGTIWPNNSYHNNIEFFPGYVFGIEPSSQGTYLYFWEQGEDKFSEDNSLTDFQNINYYNLDAFGMPVPYGLPYRSVFDNAFITNLEDGYFYSRDPELTHTVNLEYAVVWAQERVITDTVKLRNWNIEAAWLDEEGNNVTPGGAEKIAITSNDLWLGEDPEAPLMDNPQIQASGNRIFISWLQKTFEGYESQTDVYYAIYDSAGITIKEPTLLVQGEMGDFTYDTTSLVPVNQNDVLILYPYDSNDDGHSDVLLSQCITSLGEEKQNHEIISDFNIDVRNVDSERLSNGNILVSWVDYSDARVNYVLLATGENGSVTIIDGPYELPASYPADYRTPQYVSITHDENGYAVLTWNVNAPSDYLYYALIDGNTEISGSRVLTPPMRYLNGTGVFAANSPQGLAPYGGSFRIFLPLLRRP